MKTSISLKRFAFGAILVLLLGTQCSKDDDAASTTPTGGCSFTFKGTAYTLAISVCDFSPGGNLNSATNLTANQLLSLNEGSGATDGIVLSLDALGTSPDPYSSFNSGGSHSISISGSKWTFSGTLVNDNGDSGAISGTCTCTVTNP